MGYLRAIWLNNETQDLLVALAVGVATYLILISLRAFLARRAVAFAKRTDSRVADVLGAVIPATHQIFIVVIAISVAASMIELPERVGQIIEHAVVIVAILQVGFWASSSVRSWMDYRVSRSMESGDGSAVMHLSIIAFVLTALIWVILALVALDNLGFNITTLIASLGIGGVAIALAVQNILGDLFGSLSIALDKPFVVGDFIVVDDMMGTVRHVGLKTTRIQSLSGEELIFSNNDLLKSRIRNYKRMAERRVQFNFGVAYGTPADKLTQVPQIVREAVQSEEKTRFDRAHFVRFGESSLDFELVYYVLDPDYNLYMDIQQRINLALVQRLGDIGVEFPFPTRTIHVASLPENWPPARMQSQGNGDDASQSARPA